jgi:HEAT repeat protein
LPDLHTNARVKGAVITGDEEDNDPRVAWLVEQQRIAKTRITPFLMRLLGAEDRLHGELRSAAVIALAKVATEASAAEVIFQHAESAAHTALTRESAALAIGLLRRDDPARQFAPGQLDGWRTRLFRLIDDGQAPTRTRAFAAFSLGLLSDQPYATPFTKQGRMVVRDIWKRLEIRHASDDIPVALLTALGLQPEGGVPDGIKDSLKNLVLGRRCHGRKFEDRARAHALTALVRLGGAREKGLLLRLLPLRSTPREVREAAWLAIADHAARFDSTTREEALAALLASESRARSPLARGLLHVALARLFAADLHAGDVRWLAKGDLVSRLLRAPEAGNVTDRGWGALGLGLVCHELTPDLRPVAEFLNRARTTLARTLEGGRGSDEVQAAFAVAAGIGQARQVSPTLANILGDRRRTPELRGHAAVSLALFGASRPHILKSLRVALWDRRDPELGSQAALALSILGSDGEGPRLIREFEKTKTERGMAQLALSLGQFGDLAAVEALMKVAEDKGRMSLGRAMAITAIGLLADPAPRPSLSLLSDGVCHTALTSSLHEALTIL